MAATAPKGWRNRMRDPSPPSEIRRLGAWAGVIGPALFVGVFTIEGFIRPGYDAASMFVSALALGPRGAVQITNFIVFGILLLLFARGVADKFREGKASRAGPILLAIIGVSYLLSGPFVMDPVNVPMTQMSVHSRLHYFFGSIVFSLSPITCFVFFRRFRADPDWRSYQWWTLIAGAVSLAAVVLLSAGPTTAPRPPNGYNAWVGLIQRSALIPFHVWLFTFALGLLRRTARTSRTRVSSIA